MAKNNNNNAPAPAPAVVEAPAVQGGFVIETGVEIPKAKKSGAWNFLKDLQVGQSFFISGEGYREKARQAYQSARKTHNISLTQRELTEGEVTGIRLWRVAEKTA